MAESKAPTMIHRSTFLLPPAATGDGSLPTTYALVILNQRLPKFSPLLWEHEQQEFVFVLMVEPIVYLTTCRSCVLMNTMSPLSEKDYGRKHVSYGPSVIEMKTYEPFWFLWYKPDVIKGDMDSIRPDVLNFYRSMGTDIVDNSDDQDTTDLHKCISYVRDFVSDDEKPNLCILVAGALGGRFDHEMGNVNTLCHFTKTRIVLLSDDCLIQLLPGTRRHEIHIQSSVEGPHCGLIPIGAPSGSSTTTGLQWNLDSTEMKFGGLVSTSNIVKEEIVTVRSDSDLLWTISLKKQP